MRKPDRAGHLLLLLAAVLTLSACVTTTNAPFKEANVDEEVQRRVEAAIAYLREDNSEQAIVHLSRALELDDDSAAVHDTLAIVFIRTGEFERAEGHYLKAINAQPDFSRARNNYGVFLYQQERYREALEQFEIVVDDTLYDSRPGAFVNLGRCAQKLGDTERAAEAFKRAILMDKRYYPAALELADIHYGRGEYGLAQRYYDQYRQRVRSQSARSLLLGIRIARQFGDRDAEASYALALKNLYPKSQEIIEYRDMNH